LIRPELDNVKTVKPRRRGRDYYVAACPLHHGKSASLRIDIDKEPGLWYCYGTCKRGGSLRALALELGWEETEAGPARIAWLSPPYEFPRIERGFPFQIRVLSYEIGLARRSFEDRQVTRSTIRLHVPQADKPTPPPYYDFSNLSLLIDIDKLYQMLGDWAPFPLVLRLARRGSGRDTRYSVRVVRSGSPASGITALLGELFDRIRPSTPSP
jgi:hypothetical protein